MAIRIRWSCLAFLLSSEKQSSCIFIALLLVVFETLHARSTNTSNSPPTKAMSSIPAHRRATSPFGINSMPVFCRETDLR